MSKLLVLAYNVYNKNIQGLKIYYYHMVINENINSLAYLALTLPNLFLISWINL